MYQAKGSKLLSHINARLKFVGRVTSLAEQLSSILTGPLLLKYISLGTARLCGNGVEGKERGAV